VKATLPTLRTLPDASSAATARIAGGSRVLVLHERSDGWSQVQVTIYTGYEAMSKPRTPKRLDVLP